MSNNIIHYGLQEEVVSTSLYLIYLENILDPNSWKLLHVNKIIRYLLFFYIFYSYHILWNHIQFLHFQYT